MGSPSATTAAVEHPGPPCQGPRLRGDWGTSGCPQEQGVEPKLQGLLPFQTWGRWGAVTRNTNSAFGVLPSPAVLALHPGKVPLTHHVPEQPGWVLSSKALGMPGGTVLCSRSISGAIGLWGDSAQLSCVCPQAYQPQTKGPA